MSMLRFHDVRARWCCPARGLALPGLLAPSALPGLLAPSAEPAPLVTWGGGRYNSYLYKVPPAARSNVIAISAGFRHSLALKSNGRVIAWGNNYQRQLAVPPAARAQVIAIAAGGYKSFALRRDPIP